MGRLIQWDGDAWEDYCEWQKDKATLKRINALIKDIRRDPFTGIGIFIKDTRSVLMVLGLVPINGTHWGMMLQMIIALEV